MLPAFGVATITRLRPTVSSVYGEDRFDYEAAIAEELPGWSVQPAGGSTEFALRFGVRAAYVLFGPVDADVVGTDHFRVPGDARELAVVTLDRWVTGLPNDHVAITVEGWQG